MVTVQVPKWADLLFYIWMTSTKMGVVFEDEIRNLEIISEFTVFLSKTQRFAEEMCVCQMGKEDLKLISIF